MQYGFNRFGASQPRGIRGYTERSQLGLPGKFGVEGEFCPSVHHERLRNSNKGGLSVSNVERYYWVRTKQAVLGLQESQRTSEVRCRTYVHLRTVPSRRAGLRLRANPSFAGNRSNVYKRKRKENTGRSRLA